MELPDDLPVPADDGACDQLIGRQLPKTSLQSTDGHAIDLSSLSGRVVIYAYPRTGRPDQPLPTGWDTIPGARGCTPQSCGFRDHYSRMRELGAVVYGLSTQDTDYQREAVERLHLPFPLLSDADLRFSSALGLPVFGVDGMTLTKRVTLICRDGIVEHVFYPVFPPDENAANVVDWLTHNT